MRLIDLSYPPTPTLNFQFSYDDISDAVYLEDDNPPLPLTLKVFNEGSNSIKFEAPESTVITKDNYHFALKFPKRIFNDFQETNVEPSSEWDVGYDSESEALYDIVYFLYKSELTLEANQTTQLTLNNIYAVAMAGVTKGTVYLLYGLALKDSNGRSFQDNQGIYPQKEKEIQIINQFKIRFTANFEDSKNTIFSNGQPQKLTLIITNVSPFVITMRHDRASNITLIFVADDNLENTEALTTQALFQKIEIKLFLNNDATDDSQFLILKSTNAWEIRLGYLPVSWEMRPNDFLRVEFSNIVTNHNNGQTNLYVGFHNLLYYEGKTFEISTPIIKEGGSIRSQGRIKDQLGWVSPIGTVIPYVGETVPEGWLLCDGNTYETGRYSQLYELLKTGTVPNLTNQSSDGTLKYIIKG